MVKKHSPLGLIATTSADVTPPLDDVVRCCGWPLVLEANPRRLARELALHNPECVLFWLEQRQNMSTLARLIGWSRERGARPYRMAVAYHIEADVEAVFRAAGVHSFLPIADRSAAAIATPCGRCLPRRSERPPQRQPGRGRRRRIRWRPWKCRPTWCGRPERAEPLHPTDCY